MKIFLGSSTEAVKDLSQLADWLPPGAAMRWDESGSFEAGHYSFEELLRHARTADGAIFVLAEDDASNIRGKKWPTTRDNVWFEYGLFLGSLGRSRVMPVVVGNPKCATDLLGIMTIHLPKAFQPGAEETERARDEVKKWVHGLSPVFLRRQAFDVGADRTSTESSPVQNILTCKATTFLRENSSGEIRALCSDKGALAETYYRSQFEWVKHGAPNRKLRRVFVGRKAKVPFGVEFTPGELGGIRMHLEEQDRGSAIEIKWVYEDNAVLGAEYRDSLGFALFGEKWFVHWGMESGYCYQEEKDKAFGKHLAERFETLWAGAEAFDDAMARSIRAASSEDDANKRSRPAASK